MVETFVMVRYFLKWIQIKQFIPKNSYLLEVLPVVK